MMGLVAFARALLALGAGAGGTADAAPVVGIAAEPALPELEAEAVVSSCSSVFVSEGPAGCQMGTSELTNYEVQVSWRESDAGLQVTIELEGQEATKRMIRVLSFHESSKSEERWQAVGLVVAALVSAEMVKREPAPEPAEPPVVEVPVPIQRKPSREFTLEFGGIVRQEATPEFVTGGGIMRGSLGGPGIWEPTIAIGVLAGNSPVNQFSFRPSFGVGLHLLRNPIRITLRMEALAVVTNWSASDPLDPNSTDSRWHARWGGALGPTVYVPLSPVLGVFGGATGTTAFPPVEVNVKNESVGASSVFAGEGTLGLWATF